jgi:hypothetical protein
MLLISKEINRRNKNLVKVRIMKKAIIFGVHAFFLSWKPQQIGQISLKNTAMELHRKENL